MKKSRHTVEREKEELGTAAAKGDDKEAQPVPKELGHLLFLFNTPQPLATVLVVLVAVVVIVGIGKNSRGAQQEDDMEMEIEEKNDIDTICSSRGGRRGLASVGGMPCPRFFPLLRSIPPYIYIYI